MNEDIWDRILDSASSPSFQATDREPWCQFAAWVYLIAMAAHDKHTIRRGGHDYTLLRGQVFITLGDLAFTYGWSRAGVQRFLAILRMRYNVSVVSDTIGSILSIPFLQDRINTGVAAEADTLCDTRPAAPALTVEAKPDTLRDTLRRKAAAPISGDNLFNDSTKSSDKEPKGEGASHLRWKRSQTDFRLAMEYLNAKLGSKFSVSPDLEKRIAEGATLEQCKTVIDHKFEEWNGTPQAVYLRPSTLFCKKHFNEYLEQPAVKLPVSSRHVAASWKPDAYGKPTEQELEDLKRIQALDEETERAAGNID